MEEVFEVITLFQELGIEKVRLTGGEPLLRKGVPSLVARVKALPGIREVVMTTNGVLLKSFARELKAAGLDRLNISLDTLDRSNFLKITGMDKFQEVMGGIQEVFRLGLSPVKINAVLMKGYNDHEVLDLVDFAVVNACEVRFIEWMPTAGEILSERNNRFLSNIFAREIISQRYTLIPDCSNPHSPAGTFRIRGTCAKVGFISPLSNQFCKKCNRLRIKANGMLKTCLHGKEDLNIRELLRSNSTRGAIKSHIGSVVYNRPEEHFLNDATVRHQDFVMTAVGG